MKLLKNLLFKKKKLIQPNFSFKILAIADTHGYLKEEEIESVLNKEIDICVFLGDVYPDDIEMVKRFVSDDIPMIGVLGNHDDWNLLERHGIVNLHGKVKDIKEVKIGGIQGSIKYKEADYPLLTDEESCEIANLMPKADILISHDCPKHQHGNNNYAHSGLQGITEYCRKHSVPIHLYGHHHINKETYMSSGTKSICVYRIQLLEI